MSHGPMQCNGWRDPVELTLFNGGVRLETATSNVALDNCFDKGLE